MKFQYTSFAHDGSYVTIKTNKPALSVLKDGIPGVKSVEAVGPNEYKINFQDGSDNQGVLRNINSTLRSV